MKIRIYVLTAFFCFSLFSCAGLTTTEKSGPESLLYLNGTVKNQSGNEITLQMKIPELKKTPNSPIGEIAQEVVRKSLVIEGISVEIDGNQGVVKEVYGDTVKVETEKPAHYTAGTVLKLKIPKKVIAVVDFEVITGGREKEAGRVTLEDLTSALIDSGQFIIVERSKIKSIMNELQLSQSGMTKEKPEQAMGKLLLADLILTGTLAEMRGEWDINLRLVNVRTGQAMSAISMKTRLFKPSEMRDTGSLDEDFEGRFLNPAWLLRSKGDKHGKRTFQVVGIDSTTGAEGSRRSLRIDFNIEEGKINKFIGAENRKKRDLTFYDGVEFYVKATENFHGQFDVLTSQPDDPNKMDRWNGFIEIGKDWNKVRIPFGQLVLNRGWISEGASKRGASPGDQVMHIERVEEFRIGVNVKNNPDIEGSIWIDKIRFYRD